MPDYTLLRRPTSPPLDANGNWRPEWLQWFDSVERVLRSLNV